MIEKEEILENITGVLTSNKTTTPINIPIGWIYQAQQQYADEFAKAFAEFININLCEFGKDSEGYWWIFKTNDSPITTNELLNVFKQEIFKKK